jgi:hypothetical protein
MTYCEIFGFLNISYYLLNPVYYSRAACVNLIFSFYISLNIYNSLLIQTRNTSNESHKLESICWIGATLTHSIDVCRHGLIVAQLFKKYCAFYGPRSSIRLWPH